MTSQKIPEKMQAAQVVEYNAPYKITIVPVSSDLAPSELLIRVAVAFLCHTDFMVREGILGTPLPITGSHEGAGTVVAVGSAVTAFAPGDRVMAGMLYHACGSCPECKGPQPPPQYCANATACGIKGADGFFAEYARIDSRTAAKVPANVGFVTAAPLACAGCTVYKGVFAKALGLKVVGIDARDGGLELTRKGGADVVVDARKGDGAVVEGVRRVTGGAGVTATVNLSDAKAAAATSCAVTRMHSTVVHVAQPENVTIPFTELIMRDIRVRGSLVSSAKEAQDMLQLVADHGISVHSNAFEGLGEMEQLIELAESGKMKGKGVVIIDQAQIDAEGKGAL
ncbi:GroES-like protein [Bimuria novae-zelandiae CBS 107.79]|uniref:GroES-like protein n=1 Tax=Bimuria novae-zelandiae CBS 107.79 TaxID=1447943 RepID=A0A6A5V3D5_9PLEO|nr:GroES-like protein [Bimuria novae-zelandiae CBS 107.79]